MQDNLIDNEISESARFGDGIFGIIFTEFLNRIDDTVLFKPFHEEITDIVDPWSFR